jgi:hypothetical protein
MLGYILSLNFFSLEFCINNGPTDEMQFNVAATIHQLGEQSNDQSLVHWAIDQNKRVISSLRTLDVSIILVLLKALEEEGLSLLETMLVSSFFNWASSSLLT